MGQQDEAKRLIDDVLAANPSCGLALAVRGKIALLDGQLETAEKCLRQAIVQLPSVYELRYQLMSCLNKLGKQSEAREQERLFQQLRKDKLRFNEIVSREMSRSPDDAGLHCELGLILLRAGMREDGERWLRSALARNPNCRRAQTALADQNR